MMVIGVAAGEGAGAGGGVAAAGLLRGVQLVLCVARSQDWKCCWLPKLLPARQHTRHDTEVSPCGPVKDMGVAAGVCPRQRSCVAPCLSDSPRAMSCPGGVFSSPATRLFMEAVGGVLRPA